MLWQFFSLPGIEYRYFSRYRIEVRNSSIVTTLLHIALVIDMIPLHSLLRIDGGQISTI